MILRNSVKVKNYKCFGEIEQGFDNIFPLNIIIGKNNSGKSSLIDLIDFLANPNESFIKAGRKGQSDVILSDAISKEQIETFFPSNKAGGELPGQSHYHYGLNFVGTKIKYLLTRQEKKYHQIEKEYHPQAQGYFNQILTNISTPLSKKHFLRITAERDLVPEGTDDSKLELDKNGLGATNLIRQVVQNADLNHDLITRDLLLELNNIINPDIEFNEILPRKNSSHIWEIYLKDASKGLIPLSKMGSGIKTILLVLLNLIVIPEIKGYSKSNMVFGFEELENNLHPSLQRKLFNYISSYSKKFGSYFFITTHSSIVIDLFGQNEDAQIIHIENKGECSEVKTVVDHFDGKNILKDLDYRASDLLLSNGVIWVEGPSDVTYLELFLDLHRKSISDVPGRLNYTIQPLATAIWKYAGYNDFDWTRIDNSLENQIISLAKINHNHLLIIDRDDNYEDKKPSDWRKFSNGTGQNKARLICEAIKFSNNNEEDLESNFGESKNDTLLFWVNEGTFETYLEYFINHKGKTEFSKYFDLKKSRGYIEKKRAGTDHSISKVELASLIAKFAIDNELSINDFANKDSDLLSKINKLYNTIKSWN